MLSSIQKPLEITGMLDLFTSWTSVEDGCLMSTAMSLTLAEPLDGETHHGSVYQVESQSLAGFRVYYRFPFHGLTYVFVDGR